MDGELLIESITRYYWRAVGDERNGGHKIGLEKLIRPTLQNRHTEWALLPLNSTENRWGEG